MMFFGKCCGAGARFSGCLGRYKAATLMQSRWIICLTKGEK